MAGEPLELREYQRYAVAHLQGNPKAGLFLDMGLGKTASVLRALKPEHLPALVIAPKRVAERVWPKEATKWRPGTKLYVASGTKLQRDRQLGYADRADIVVIGRENVKDILAKWPKGHPFKTVVLDELSSFKGRGVRWAAVRKIVKGVPHVWGLTGTPTPNGLHDLWAQVGLLDGGERCGKTLKEWRGNYFVAGYTLPNGVVTRWDPRPEAIPKIYAKIEDICLSMATDGRIELPELTFNIVDVPLDHTVKRVYKTLHDELVVDLDMIGGGVHAAETAAALSNRLQQVTAGFIYNDPDDERGAGYDVLHRNKAYAVREIVDGSSGGVLVVYRYKPELEMIQSVLGADAFTIDDPGVLDAWDEGNVPVLLVHPQSVGHGLNLQYGGHTMVWATPTWSLEEWEQTNKRLHRSGQANPVVVHVLSSPGTVDEAVAKALIRKDNVQKALLAHLESPV